VAHYLKAPIVEALIDFRARLPAGTSASSLKNVFQSSAQEFEDPLPLSRGIVQVTVEAGHRPDIEQNVEDIGYVFKGIDGRHFVQARHDGFGCSRLAPYDRWETFREHTRRLWDIYRAAAKPEAVTGVTLKYVNRFDIPLPIADFKDYFLTVPEVAPGLPQQLAGFFMQVQIPYSDPTAMLVLTQTLVPPPAMGIGSVALDINLSVDNNVFGTDDELWLLLDKFRDRKNSVFEACLTPKARELIS
jgi:uncharacterized protein (TIGR04255 family)